MVPARERVQARGQVGWGLAFVTHLCKVARVAPRAFQEENKMYRRITISALTNHSQLARVIATSLTLILPTPHSADQAMRRPPRRIQRLAHLALAILDPESIVNQVSSRHLRVPYRRVHADQFQDPVNRGDDLTGDVVFGIWQYIPARRLRNSISYCYPVLVAIDPPLTYRSRGPLAPSPCVPTSPRLHAW